MQDMYELNEQEKKQVCDEIAQFFREEYDLELGIIGTGNILDFFQGVLGCRVYNKALDDAKRWLNRTVENAESDFYALYKSSR